MTIPALCFLMLSCSFLILKHNKISITSIEQNNNSYLIILAEEKLRKNDIPPLGFIVMATVVALRMQLNLPLPVTPTVVKQIPGVCHLALCVLLKPVVVHTALEVLVSLK